MDVLQNLKWSNQELFLSEHAIMRASERETPLPKYIPLNSRCVKTIDFVDCKKFKVVFTYNDDEYCALVSEDGTIVTVYPYEIEGKEEYRNSLFNAYKQSIIDTWKKVDKLVMVDGYICLESEVDNDNFISCVA